MQIINMRIISEKQLADAYQTPKLQTGFFPFHLPPPRDAPAVAVAVLECWITFT